MTVHAMSLLKERIYNVSGTTQGILSKLSVNVELN